jgi:hypothetical protein
MRHPSICKNCGFTISGNYCEQCGQKTSVAPITLQSIFHEVFHYFTHLDKGFGYTLKKLITEPGTMQRQYVEGERARHQKPFSMFFICGTITGLGYYFIHLLMARLHGQQDAAETDFFRHYFVIAQALMLPLYTLITWLFFKNEVYNYAETLIMMLYNTALVYLALVPINALQLLFPGYENRYLELSFVLVYNMATNLHFYNGKRSVVVIKSLLVILACYGVSQLFSELFINLLRP